MRFICDCNRVKGNGSNTAARLDVAKRPLVSSAEKGDILAQSGGSVLSDTEKHQLILRRMKLL